MAESNSRGPGVWFPPPLFFVAGFLVGYLLGRIYPMPMVPRRLETALGVAGFAITALGVAIAAWGMLTFARAHTAIVPVRPASQLVEAGPYRYTRNPMYSGLTVAYLGVAALFNAAWPLLVLPVVVFALRRLVVDREEAYLQREFGAQYDDYRRRVKRWL